MRKVFLDTNFIVDYFIREDYSGNAEKVVKLGDKNQWKFHISYLTVANFAYIMRKLPANKLSDLIKKICSSFSVIDNTKEQILLNLNEVVPDIEDGLQYQAALFAGCEYIVTRNKKDFPFVNVMVYTTEEILELFS